MNRRLIARLCAGLLFAMLAWVAYTQNQGKPPELTITKIHDDLYEIVGDGGNVAVLVTSEGILLVDDKFEQDHDAILAKIKTVSKQPVKYVINTHYHQDHSGGNAKFLPTADVISTENARANILQHKQSNVTGSPVAPARIVFNDETAVFLGGKEVRAKFFGRGHTNGDAVVYFPQLKTIHTGDLMAGTSPLIDYNGGGSLLEWTKTLDAVMKLDFDTVIPGHGDVTNKAGLKTYRDNIEKLQTRVRGLIRSGKTQQEVAKVMTDEYKWAPNSLQQQWSVP
ncbi:MAG TPA: MBL fold metallo-hydrolase, partial [Bryobacteraceae bacterium]